MKYITYFLVIVVLIGCTANNETSSNVQEKIDVVHQYINAIVKQDAEAMDKLLSDDCQFIGPALNVSVSKSDNISDWKRSWEERVVSMQYKRINSSMISIEKGKLAGEWIADWGQVNTLYKDGKTAKFWFNGLYKVENGMITEARVVYDNMDILSQLGYKFLPPSDFLDETGN